MALPIFQRLIKPMVTDLLCAKGDLAGQSIATGFYYAFPAKEAGQVFPVLLIPSFVLDRGEEFVFSFPLSGDDKAHDKHYFRAKNIEFRSHLLKNGSWIAFPVGSLISRVENEFHESCSEAVRTTVAIVPSSYDSVPMITTGFALPADRECAGIAKQQPIPVLLTDEVATSSSDSFYIPLKTCQEDVGMPIFEYLFGTLLGGNSASFGKRLYLVGIVSKSSSPESAISEVTPFRSLLVEIQDKLDALSGNEN